MKLPDKIDAIFKDKKKFAGILVLLSIGLMLVALSSLPQGSKSDSTEEQTLSEYKTELESELESVCSSVKGVGKCKVMVTFERGAENTYKGSVLLESKPPRVMGITVICAGAQSDTVRAELTTMLSALFDIGKNRVAVLELKN